MSDIITINKKCKSCEGSMKIERCSQDGFRWNIIFCENFCWQFNTSKKKIKVSDSFARYINVGNKSFLSTDNVYFREAYLKRGSKKNLPYLKVCVLPHKFKETDLING